MRSLLCPALILCLLTAASGVGFAQTREGPADDMRILEGEEIILPKESLLMRELGQTHSHTSKLRRFEIVFFISIPITLLFGFSLMEGLSQNVPDRFNPDRDMRQPHYIYMFATALFTSLYVAIDDVRRYNPPEKVSSTSTEVSGMFFELPIVGVRF